MCTLRAPFGGCVPRYLGTQSHLFIRVVPPILRVLNQFSFRRKRKMMLAPRTDNSSDNNARGFCSNVECAPTKNSAFPPHSGPHPGEQHNNRHTDTTHLHTVRVIRTVHTFGVVHTCRYASSSVSKNSVSIHQFCFKQLANTPHPPPRAPIACEVLCERHSHPPAMLNLGG